jgi:hypothetical protein
MGDPLSDISVEVVVIVLFGLIAVNMVLLTALVVRIGQDRARLAGSSTEAFRGPSTGPESGSV